MQIPMLLDAHAHVRVGDIMDATVPLLARYCRAAVIEPNTADVRTGVLASAHRKQVVSVARTAGFPGFRPLMTVMLTDETDPADVATWPDAGVVAGKCYPGALYPHGGVNDIFKIDDVLSEMGRAGIPLSCHIERAGIHPLDAEWAAIDDFRRFADRGDVRVIFEHVSDARSLEVIRQYPHAYATITPQHLWMTVADVYDGNGDIRNNYNLCRPVAKTSDDREALRVAAMSGTPSIFYGSDFAPHLAFSKANIPPPAGCACYPAAVSVLAAVFAKYGQLDKLAGFISEHGADFYGVRAKAGTGTLQVTEEEWRVPSHIPVGSQGELIVSWLAGEILPISVA